MANEWQLEREFYQVSAEHNFILKVYEYQTIQRTQLNEDGTATEVAEQVPSKVHEFKVKREILAINSAYFKKILYDEEGQPGTEDVIAIHDEARSSIELWAKILHGSDIHSTLSSINIKGVWDMLATAYRYELDPSKPGAKAWFEAWYKANRVKSEEGRFFDFKDYQSLLFPCHSLDYAEGFQQATRYLAYRAQGHITEKKPDGVMYDFLRLDQNIMHQLNAAKGRLKTVLHRALYNPIDKLLKLANCPCKAETLFAYELALSNTGAWPLESAFLNNSVHEIVNKLDMFETKNLPQRCHDCGFNYAEAVRKAVDDARRYFDGLCLDCMDASKLKLDSDDQDYWKHAGLGVAWDQGCRIRHKQPTWYFSFMGRRAKMMEWTKYRHGGGRGRNARGSTGGSADEIATDVGSVNLNE